MLPHLITVLGFVLVSVTYFHPILSGKKMRQSDIIQYMGMSKQQTDFRNSQGEEPYWTDRAFGGMATYQLGAQYPYHFIKKIDRTIRFLPRPADYLFLYFIGFYVLLLILDVDYKLAFLGSIAFGFSCYFITILGVGHNAKAHAIGYMPLVIAGVVLTFKKKYIWGFILLSISMALEIAANHFQMTYYLCMLIVVLGISYLIDAYRKGALQHYFKAIGIMCVAVLFSLLLNATSLLATKEYAQFSTRGDTGLTITPDEQSKTHKGLDFEYITQYSYGIIESFNLLIPRFMGGASTENIGIDSATYEALLKLGVSPNQALSIVSYAPTYWGDQPYVGGLAYIGATVLFLFVLGLFLVQGRLKWWIVGVSILALLLSWGKNFEFLSRFFVNFIPMYNKFRAVSSIQVLIELSVPILGIIGLQKFLNSTLSPEKKLKSLVYTTSIVAGIPLLFLCFKSILFDFTGNSDHILLEQGGPDYLWAVKDDRKTLFINDILRTIILVVLLASSCWFYLKQKLKKNYLIICIGLLILFDLVNLNLKYVNEDNFIAARELNIPFKATSADKTILKDKSHYRVYDMTGNPFNTGRTSYFHNAIGGYHAAKPGRMQDINDFYISNGKVEILNMLNVKYFIIQDPKKGAVAQRNPKAYGNAWFAKNVLFVDDVNKEILTLNDSNTKNDVIINKKYASLVPKKQFVVDTTSTLKLTKHQPNYQVYKSENNQDGFAVFSEMYYPGWKVYIDDSLVEHSQVNYLLRGVYLPKGKHTIEFKFEPDVIKTGSLISISSTIVYIILIGIALYFQRLKSKSTGASIEASK